MLQFCHVKHRWFACSRPWVGGGYWCATDGRVALRTPCSDADHVAPNLIPASQFHAVFQRMGVYTPRQIPPLPPEVRHVCVDCAGMGRVKECAACGGTGTIGYADLSAADCKECKGCGNLPGRGDDPCEACQAGGTVLNPEFRRVRLAPGYVIAEEYARLLVRHGVSVVEVPEKSTQQCRFGFGEFEGVLMPCVDDACRDVIEMDGSIRDAFSPLPEAK